MLREVRVLPKLLVVVVSLGVIAWGSRALVFEGYVFAAERGFNGDFTSAMFSPDWRGDSIIYGPIFLFEKWLMDVFPGILTITAFALLCWVLTAVAFVACVFAAGLPGWLVPVALAVWLVSVRLSYALSIAANPEFLILSFLSVAWLAAARKSGRGALEGAMIALAGLTKLIPFAFILLPLLRMDRRAITAFLVVVAAAIIVTSVGLRQSPIDTAIGTLLPFGRADVGSSVGFLNQVVVSDEFSGVNSALARGLGVRPAAQGFTVPPDAAAPIQAATVAIIIACVMVAAWVAHAVPSTDFGHRAGLSVAYSAFFALLPIANLYPHRHTFIFVLPIATALLAVLSADPDRTRRWAFLAVFGLLYVYTGVSSVPLAVDRLAGTRLADAWSSAEPIWGTVALLICIAAYTLVRRAPRPVIRGAVAATA